MDTIFALSSGGLPAGVAVIRLSGPEALAAAGRLAPPLPPSRRASLRTLRDPGTAMPLDRGLVLALPGPTSFTGEDMAELQVHGGRAVVAAITAALRSLGLRPAEPGEFTRRAFGNGRLDLTEVEGLGDLIAAETEAQRRQAVALSGGDLARRVSAWRETLINLRAEVEGILDFSDEGDVGAQLSMDFHSALRSLLDDVGAALAGAGRGMIVRDGARIAILGPPNAGKSSLLNALAKRDVAIVTPEAGTTRDVLEVALDLGGALALLQDTAGLRETQSLAEQAGIARAGAAARDADLVLWLAEGGAPSPPPLGTRAPVWTVATKADLTRPGVPTAHVISAVTSEGLARLEDDLASFVADRAGAHEPSVIVNARQQAATQAIRDALAEAQRTGDADPVLAAEALRRASDALGRLTGRIGVEEVLGHIFARFCIGK